jgi:transposase-like protein
MATKKKKRPASHIEVPKPANAWSQQIGESPQAYEAFRLWFEADPRPDDFIPKLAKQLGKHFTQVYTWRKRWNWEERLRAFNNDKVLKLEAEQQKALKKKAQEWAERRINIREDGFEVGKRLLERAIGLLNLPVADKKVTKRAVTQSGEEYEQEVTYVFQQHPRDARLFALTGMQLMRLSADMSTENLTIQSEGVNLDEIDDPETLMKYADELEKIRRKQLEAGDV